MCLGVVRMCVVENLRADCEWCSIPDGGQIDAPVVRGTLDPL